jgi:energy-coupling factor transporter transmembrane protein EcfT
MLAVLAVGLGLLTGEHDLPLGPLTMSSTGLALGIQMTVRAVAILLAIYTVTTGLSLTAVALLLERVGFKGLGFALGVALNALPMVQANFRDALTALRLRGGFQRRRPRAIRLLLLTTITSSVRHAESIVAAAEARGFTIGRGAPRHINWRIGDAVLLVFLSLAAGAILIH